MKPNILTKEEFLQLCEKYSVNDLAKMLNMTTTAVIARMKKFGVYQKKERKRKLIITETQEEKDKLLNFYNRPKPDYE